MELIIRQMIKAPTNFWWGLRGCATLVKRGVSGRKLHRNRRGRQHLARNGWRGRRRGGPWGRRGGSANLMHFRLFPKRDRTRHRRAPSSLQTPQIVFPWLSEFRRVRSIPGIRPPSMQASNPPRPHLAHPPFSVRTAAPPPRAMEID